MSETKPTSRYPISGDFMRGFCECSRLIHGGPDSSQIYKFDFIVSTGKVRVSFHFLMNYNDDVWGGNQFTWTPNQSLDDLREEFFKAFDEIRDNAEKLYEPFLTPAKEHAHQS